VTVPFLRTIKLTKQNGLGKTASMILGIALKYATERIVYLPEKSIVEVNNSKMILSPRQGGINYDLYLYKKREPLCTDYLIQSHILKEGDVALDLGANIGYYVLIESKLVGETGKVYAVEPVTTTFNLMEKNLRINKLKNVSTYNFAFGDKVEESEIFVCNESNWCAMNKYAVGGKILGAQKVHVETVDSFFKGKKGPKLIRMDVEGWEYQIIKGMPETLKGDVRLLVELHYGLPFMSPKRMDELLHILEQNNFRVRFVVFEDKVQENRVIRRLLKKGGYKLPFFVTNISLQELKKLLQENLMSPNVLFEKASSTD